MNNVFVKNIIKSNNVPNDALKDNELDHEVLSVLSVHGLKQRDAHNESVRERGDGEESDEPIETTRLEENGP